MQQIIKLTLQMQDGRKEVPSMLSSLRMMNTSSL